jgi:hypothetical protein
MVLGESVGSGSGANCATGPRWWCSLLVSSTMQQKLYLHIAAQHDVPVAEGMDASGCSNLILFFHADQLQTSNLTPVRFDNHVKWVRDPSESASTNLRMKHSGRKRRGGHIGCTTSTVRLARLKLLRRDEKKDNMRNGLHSASSNNPAFHSPSLSIC